MTPEEVVDRNDLIEAVSRYTQLKKRCGPCPKCGGTDRFRVWKSPDRWLWHCRGCHEKWGDVIDFVQWIGNMTWKESYIRLGGSSEEAKTVRCPCETCGRHTVLTDQWGRARCSECQERCRAHLVDDRAFGDLRRIVLKYRKYVEAKKDGWRERYELIRIWDLMVYLEQNMDTFTRMVERDRVMEDILDEMRAASIRRDAEIAEREERSSGVPA
jgi:hypothetical protein